MLSDKVFDFVVNAVREQERFRIRDEKKGDPVHYSSVKIVRPARSLVGPCKARAAHHREREKFYTAELEKNEKKLRDEGVTVDICDPKTGISYGPANMIASGAICNTGTSPFGVVPKFEAKINQEMLGEVEKAKNKMIEHRDCAVQYEKLARAYGCVPETQMVELSVEDIHYFRLES